MARARRTRCGPPPAPPAGHRGGGLTVIGCLAGLFVAGFQAFDGIASGTMIVVALCVFGSLTFLPVLLSLLGKATDKLRVPFLGRRQATARPSRLWHAVVTAVTRHPLALGGLAAAALLALATPLLSLHLEDPGIDSLPAPCPWSAPSIRSSPRSLAVRRQPRSSSPATTSPGRRSPRPSRR